MIVILFTVGTYIICTYSYILYTIYTIILLTLPVQHIFCNHVNILVSKTFNLNKYTIQDLAISIIKRQG